jgi:hypothetical protein
MLFEAVTVANVSTAVFWVVTALWSGICLPLFGNHPFPHSFRLEKLMTVCSTREVAARGLS